MVVQRRLALRRGLRRGFTLMEMLVVVGIIIIMTALAIPGISKFLEGQGLSQSGRILQSTFNECRRAAITQRSRNYLVFFRQADPSRPGEYMYGMRRYRERVGYEGEPAFLLAGTMFDLEPGNTSTVPGAMGMIKGIVAPVFDELPDEVDGGTLFGPTRRPVSSPGQGWIEFRRDGTMKLDNLTDNIPYVFPTGEGLFDLNVPIELDQAAFDNLAGVGAPAKTDMNLRETTNQSSDDAGAMVDKRCFVDIDPNTGRVYFRVVEIVQ